jgi:hypothetical protein
MMVEKVFFQKPEGDYTIDLGKENPYTFFMVSFFLCDILYTNYKMGGNLNADCFRSYF